MEYKKVTNEEDYAQYKSKNNFNMLREAVKRTLESIAE